jgi:hypothetical protein
MATQSTTRATSKGICSFCKGEFDKGKMTQHLRYCKQRASSIAAEAEDATKQKTRLFHLVIEGRYNPQYWLHLEVPASESLATVDDFLRGIWLERFEHLSGFKIGETFYSTEPEDLGFGRFKVLEEGETVEEEEEEGESDDIVHGEELLADLPISPESLSLLPSDVMNKLNKQWAIDDLVDFLKETLKSNSKSRPRGSEGWEEFHRWIVLRDILETMLDMVEDRSMEVQLGRVLKVGQKFSYEFDFGSTTHLNLRVASEREGVVRDEKKPVEILARNSAPAILCKVCGKPAEKIVSGYYNVEEDAYCNTCARKRKNYEMMLPIINSPRVGVL